MLMTTHEGFETLAVSELHKKSAAMTLHQYKGIKFTLIPLVSEAAKVTPVDLEGVTRKGFESNITALLRPWTNPLPIPCAPPSPC